MSRIRAKGSKPIIGLAGGIGAGKSTVARILESLGAAVIDSDRLAHEELQDPFVAQTLRSWWGDRVCLPDGRIDRKAVGSIVFESPAELARLENLLYPRLHQRREQLVEEYESDSAVRAIVLDAPKLYEAGLGDYCDVVIFVEAALPDRVRRVVPRGWSGEELRRRENMQDPLDIKKANADYVVINHSTLESLRIEVQKVFSSVLARFS